MDEPRFVECPECKGVDIEINEVFGEKWGCWDCAWTEELNQEEKDARLTGEDLG